MGDGEAAMTRIMFTIFLGFSIALLAGIFCVVQNNQCSVCDGDYQLHVEVVASDPKSIEAVYCNAYHSTEQAQEYMDYYRIPRAPFENLAFGELVQPFRGERITLLIPFTDRIYGSGRHQEIYPFRQLLVVAQYKRGERVGRVVDISKCREGDQVTVTVP